MKATVHAACHGDEAVGVLPRVATLANMHVIVEVVERRVVRQLAADVVEQLERGSRQRHGDARVLGVTVEERVGHDIGRAGFKFHAKSKPSNLLNH
jgi:hypothetical protein